MYNFKAARQRIEELKLIYRQNKKHHQEDGTWDWWLMAQIEEIEKEIHKNRTAVLHDDRSAKKKVYPIITQWGGANQ
ncbi:hypothetical protein ABNB59_15370 [Paenibacillus larvae]|uniref:Uncharacterized protein n=1 Tax=Paenibacillus larvae TaxID=1464 RepID=A0AAP5JPW1_9BACL|nr:hypothetical protein [Paenibacillus larvae]AQR76357.1 hypothetical protein BXP28_02130 [Paenibacillus larvae subsp. larvae]AVF22835.1 hypothetical protein ERICI_03025 [Paenibacillus larvae subsp. larvae]ETK26508.1 hypothetical protein ERIC1_2c07300 [Paenibacillus larvae subsp. larvae DSM 25719]MCY7476025.1 hypothetical protein [Paenibacillus larvae]MCY7490143.1 hypothetical protein [Paenibacillus larvae]